MSECHACGQWDVGSGGIGCICGKTQCPGCGHYEHILEGKTHCWLCSGQIKQRARSAAEGALHKALEEAIPALERCISPSIQALLEAWEAVDVFRQEDRKRDEFLKRLSGGELRLRVRQGK